MDKEFLAELVGRAKTCAELADLPFGAITAFYDSKEEDNEAQVTIEHTV